MIKKIQIKDTEGNVTGTYDVGQIDPSSVSTIDDFVSNKDVINNLISNSAKIVNTAKAFNNNVFTTQYTSNGLNIDGDNITITANLSFNKNNTISSGDLNSNPNTSHVTQIVTIPYTKKQDEGAYGISINLQEFISASNDKDNFTDIKFNITLLEDIESGIEKPITPFEPIDPIDNQNENDSEQTLQKTQSLDKEVTIFTKVISYQYLKSNSVTVGETKYLTEEKGKFTVTLPLSEIKQAINNGAVELFFYMTNDQSLYDSDDFGVLMDMTQAPALECTVNDILKFVNWAKSNNYGPWAY